MPPKIVIRNENNEIIEELNFGVIQHGATKTLQLTLANEGEHDFEDIEMSIDNENIKMTETPTKIKARQKQNITVFWTANEPLTGRSTRLLMRGKYIV